MTNLDIVAVVALHAIGLLFVGIVVLTVRVTNE